MMASRQPVRGDQVSALKQNEYPFVSTPAGSEWGSTEPGANEGNSTCGPRCVGFRPHLWGNLTVEARSLSSVVTEPFPLSGFVQPQFCHLLHSNDF